MYVCKRVRKYLKGFLLTNDYFAKSTRYLSFDTFFQACTTSVFFEKHNEVPKIKSDKC